jgi:hypothetical protein
MKKWEDTDLFRKISDGPMTSTRDGLIKGLVWVTNTLSYGLVKIGFSDTTVIGEYTAAEIVKEDQKYKKALVEYYQANRDEIKRHVEPVEEKPVNPNLVRKQVMQLVSFKEQKSFSTDPDFDVEQTDSRHVEWTRKQKP